MGLNAQLNTEIKLNVIDNLNITTILSNSKIRLTYYIEIQGQMYFNNNEEIYNKKRHDRDDDKENVLT